MNQEIKLLGQGIPEQPPINSPEAVTPNDIRDFSKIPNPRYAKYLTRFDERLKALNLPFPISKMN